METGMIQTRSAIYLNGRTTFVLLLLLFASACGLGMDTQAQLERGQKALGNGEYRAAIIDAKNVLSDEPNNVAARLLLGRSSVAIGDAVAAEKELRRAVELGVASSVVLVDLGQSLLLQMKYDEVILEIQPGSATSEADRLAALRMRGEALLKLRQPDAAREIFAEVLASNDDDISAYLGIVNSYIVERNFFQAREILNNIVSFGESHIAFWLTSGSLSLHMRDAKRSANDFTIAARLARESTDNAAEMIALSGLSDALLAESDIDAARQASVRMAEIASDDIRTLLLSARLASIDTDWSTAQELLQKILMQAPELRQAQMLLGNVHKESGNLGQAEMYLSAVVAAAPGNSNARLLLAETRLALEKADEARQILEPLLARQDADIDSLALAAVASLDLGEFDVATELLERAVAAEPGNVGLRIQLAFTYFRSENPGKAQDILESLPEDIDGGNEFRRHILHVMTQIAQESPLVALESAKALATRWPSRSEAYQLLGKVEMSTGDNVAARKSLEIASGLLSDDIQTMRYLARLDEMEGDFESAKGRFELILELAPNDTRSMVALARQSARDENYTKAREWLERASTSDSSAVAPRELLASLLLSQREYAEAEAVAAAALRQNAANSRLQSMLGLAQLNRGNPGSAAISFGKAVELAPQEASYRVNLARAQAMSAQTTQALETLQQDAARSMRHIPSAMLLATLKADAGDLEGAEEIARQLRRANPDRAVVYALQAELTVRRGDLVAASRAYDKALSIENLPQLAQRAYQIRSQAGLDNQVAPLVNYLDERPFDSTMRNYLAQAYQDIDKIGQASAQYEHVLRLEPENFVSANNLAWIYFQSGDPRAEEIARQAYTIQPDSGAVNDTLGWILVQKGYVKEGTAVLRRAVELGEGRTEIRYHLAAGLAASGNTSEAKSILRDILATENKFNSRQQAQELLLSL